MPCSGQHLVRCIPAPSVCSTRCSRKQLTAFFGAHCRCMTEMLTLRRPPCPPCRPLLRRCSQQSLWHLTSPPPASLPSQGLPRRLPSSRRQSRTRRRRQSSSLLSLLPRRPQLLSMCAAWPSAAWQAWRRGTGGWSVWLHWPRTLLSGGLLGWTGGRGQGGTWR